MKKRYLIPAIAACVLASAFAVGVRVFVIKPIGAIPQGVSAVVMGVPGLRIVDSPDAFCLRQTGGVTLICRGAVAARVANQGRVLLRLPYSSILDNLAGTPQTVR